MAKPSLEILFEDDQIIAVNKPSGMLTLPDRHDGELQSLRGILQKQYGEIYVVHRIDKDTSGLIVFAKNATAHKYMSNLFESRDIQKYYLGFIKGKPLETSGIIDAPIAEHPAKNGSMIIHQKGKAAQTGFEIIAAFPQISLVKFEIFTGRTHQIRVHAKHWGFPIIADPIYGDGKSILLSSIKKKYNLNKNSELEQPILSRLALHASQLNFTNAAGIKQTLEAPLHKDMRALLQQLQKISTS